jgi:hypothetical protein
MVQLTKRICRCRFCGHEMRVASLSYELNPYCGRCLRERMEKAASETRMLSWAPCGDVLRPTLLDLKRLQ